MRDDLLEDGVSSLCLAVGSSPVLLTGTLVEQALATISVPPSAVRPNSLFRIWTMWSVTNNANVKTVRLRANGVVWHVSALTSVATGSIMGLTPMRGLSGQAHNPAMTAPFITGVAPVALTSVDCSTGFELTVTAQLTNIADSMTLEAYCVEVLGR